MAPLAPADAVKFIDWCDAHIPAESLAGDGYEREIHVTVAYGFSPEVDSTELGEVLATTLPFHLTLGEISRFECEENDVLKVEVRSPDLEALHYVLRELFGKRLEVTYDDYKPHLTLACVKKGTLTELDGHAKFQGSTHGIHHLAYSAPDGAKKTFLSLKTP